jgi:formylglycine-generating enzyme required for sulfatase activity
MIKRFLLLPVLFSGLVSLAQGNINVQMVYVKGGYFFRGSDDRKYLSEEYENEKPVHRVNVTSFAISKYEITQGQWRTLMGILPTPYNGADYANKDCDNCPVVKVSYDDVQEFIKRLNEKYPGKNYRLPTELEWEYAARGGKYSGNYTYAGSNKLSSVGWYGRPKGATHPIGEKEPNELGIYDMSGNVLEWCSDWYDADYYKTTLDAVDPKGPAAGEKKVARGGSYYDDDAVCRTVYRSRFTPKTRQWNLGFRLATDN